MQTFEGFDDNVWGLLRQTSLKQMTLDVFFKCVNRINCLANKLLIKLLHTAINFPVVCRYSIVLSHLYAQE